MDQFLLPQGGTQSNILRELRIFIGQGVFGRKSPLKESSGRNTQGKLQEDLYLAPPLASGASWIVLVVNISGIIVFIFLHMLPKLGSCIVLYSYKPGMLHSQRLLFLFSQVTACVNDFFFTIGCAKGVDLQS